MTRARRLGLLKVACSAALIAFLLSRCNLSSLFAVWSKLSGWVFASCVGLILLAVLADSFSWLNLQRAAGTVLDFKTILRVQLIGRFFSCFLAGFVGEDASRIYFARVPGQMATLATTVLALRLLGIVALSCIGMIASLTLLGLRGISLASGIQMMWPISLVATGAALPLLLLFVPPAWWISPLRRVLRARPALREKFESYGHMLNHMAYAPAARTALCWTVLNHLLSYCAAWRLADALGLPVTLLDMLAIMPLVTVAVFLPISFGGMGVREATFLGAFTLLGLSETNSKETILALSLAYYAVGLCVGLLGGILLALPAPPHEAHPPDQGAG